jgi:hypothetical protein
MAGCWNVATDTRYFLKIEFNFTFLHTPRQVFRVLLILYCTIEALCARLISLIGVTKFCPPHPLGFDFSNFISCQSQWPRSLRCGFAATCLLGLWVQIPPGACMSISCECCEVSASGWSLLHRSTTECGVSECDCEASIIRRSCPTRGCRAITKYIYWRVKGTKIPIIYRVYPPLFSIQTLSALAVCMVQYDTVWNQGSSEINGPIEDLVFMKYLKCILVMLIILTWFRFKACGCAWFCWSCWTFGMCHRKISLIYESNILHALRNC